MLLLNFIYIPLLPFLDRLGGGGYDNLPAPFNTGQKWARRFLLPSLLWLLSLTLTNAVYCATLAFIFCFNLDEIEERNWEEIFLWTATFFFCLTPTCGWYGLIPACWWPLGIYLSNIGVKGRKLDWFFVELFRGLFIAVGALLYAIL
jgi:hypothetical protein